MVYNGEQDKVPGMVESALGWMISQARMSLGLWQSWHRASWVSGGSVREASWGWILQGKIQLLSLERKM